MGVCVHHVAGLMSLGIKIVIYGCKQEEVGMSRLMRSIVMALLIVALSLASGILTACGARQGAVAPDNADAQVVAAERAVQWLRGQQESDGSFPTAFGHPAAITLDALLAGAAAGQDVSEWRSGDQSALNYLAATMDEYAIGADTMGKLVAGVVAAGENPAAFAQTDLVRRLLGYHNGQGAFGETAVQQSWALMALAAAGSPIEPAMTNALIDMQTPEGGWDSGWGVDADTTSLAMQALVAAGTSPDHEAIARGLEYLRSQQATTGGFYSFGTDSNPNTTAFAIQALVAAGQDPEGAEWSQDGQSPMEDLLRFQLADGSFEYAPGDGSNLYATVQAIPALMSQPFPIR